MSNIIQRNEAIDVVVANKTVLPPNLPITQKAREVYLSNKNFLRIKDILDANVVVKNIHTYINQTIMDKGVNMPPEEIQYLKQRVTDDIIRHYPNYTLEEIRLALYYGVRGELGEYFGINPIGIFKWLKAFRFDLMPQCYLLIKKHLPAPESKTDKPEISDEELDNIYTSRVIEILTSLQDGHQYNFYDYGNCIYEWLQKIKLLTFTNEEKLELFEESKVKYRKSLKDENSEYVSRGRSILKIDIEQRLKDIEGGYNKDGRNAIVIGAKRIGLHRWFEEKRSSITPDELKEKITIFLTQNKQDEK